MKHKRFLLCSLFVSAALATSSICSMTPYTASATSATEIGARNYIRYNCSTKSVDLQYQLKTEYDSGIQAQTIIGDNDMVETKMSSVILLADARSLGGNGTGFIVGKHEIVTNAHCLYTRSTGVYSDYKIRIQNDNQTVYLTPTYFHIPKSYINNDTDYPEYDYALITVEEDLTQYGRFQLGVITDSFVQSGKDVSVTGYSLLADPKDYENIPGYSYGMQLTASGAITKSTDSIYTWYLTDTAMGSSGGPVYIHEEYDDNSYDTAIAVNRAIGATENCGVRFNAAHLQFYMNNPYE